MNDFPIDGAAPATGLPSPTVFVTAAGSEMPADLTSDGTTVLLLVGEVDSAWAVETAVELCRGMSVAGHRLVLVDLHVEDPLLHARFGVENLEGIVDVFLYGASISRSARALDGYGFHLITAGTYESDPETIFRHPRWSKLVAGFRDAAAELVLFAPESTFDPDAMSAWVDRVVLLGHPRSPRVLDAIERGTMPATALLVPEGEMSAPLADREQEAAELLETSEPLPIEGDGTPEIAVERKNEPAGGRSWLRMGVVILVLMVLLAAAGFALARYQPHLVPWLVPDGPTPAESLPATAQSTSTPAPVRAGDPVPFAVLVRSYASLNAAEQQMEVEQSRFEDTPFYISPEDDAGVLYYKIYAGMLRDTASAERLRERLLEAGAMDTQDTLGTLSLIHRAHLSFDLGEFAQSSEAQMARDSLAELNIPSYAVPVPYADGSRRWQLYAGAYRDSASASAMREQLASAGVEPRLVLRVGEQAPGE